VEAYKLVSGDIQLLRAQSISLQQIALRLNLEGHRTVMGKHWQPTQVCHVLLRCAEIVT